MTVIKEGRWDCSHCTESGIPARHKACPGCGDPRSPHLDPEEATYLPQDAAVVTDKDLLDLANAGPDWYCGHCGTTNRGDRTLCESCDRPRDADDTVERTRTYLSGVAAEGAQFDSPQDAEDERIEDLTSGYDEDEKLVSDAPDEPDRLRPLTLPASALRRTGEIATRVAGYLKERNERQGRKLRIPTGPLLIGGVVVLFAVALFACGWAIWTMFFKTEPVDLTVSNLTWERQVEVEEFRTFTESDWFLPAGGRIIRSYQDIHHYEEEFSHFEPKLHTWTERVWVGTEPVRTACGSRDVDYGNGFYGEETVYCDSSVDVYETVTHQEWRDEPVYVDVPVYQTRYEYEIDRWVFDHWEIASGEVGSEPYWPEDFFLEDDQRRGDDRTEEYLVELHNVEHDRTYEREADEDVWADLEEGEVVVGHVNRNHDLRDVDWPDGD